MTAYEWREVTVTHLNLRGNAYTRIQRDGQGQVAALWPMHPDHVEVVRHEITGGLAYKYTPVTGGGTYKAEDVLHFKGLSPNGLKGYDPLTLERETYGHYIAAQRYGAETLANDSTPPGVLSHPGELGKEARSRVGESWQAAHGAGQRGSIAILEEGMTFIPTNITLENAQFIETLKLKRSDIAGIFRVPPHMIGDLDKATFSNIEHQDLSFSKHTLVPWCERMEQVMDEGLLTESERASGFYVEHNLNAIMRGDLKSRMESYGQLWDRGIMNADEIRALENQNAQPDDLGKKYYVPMNFRDASTEPPAAPVAGIPAARDAGVTSTPERRQNGWNNREGIQKSAIPTIEDAYRRITRRDTQNVRAALKKVKSPAELSAWLETYFADSDYARKQLIPVIRSYAIALGTALMMEIDERWEFNDALQAWVESYTNTLADFNQRGGLAQLNAVIKDAEGNVNELIDARLDEWENGSDTRASRPRAIAEHESVRFGGAFAVTAFAAAGVSKLVWRTVGDNCPICDSLNGEVVGITEAFADDKSEMPNGFSPRGAVTHPPLHAGCDCVISPEE
jgi:HK97 family phage portal protein